MVERQLQPRNICDPRVLAAMEKVPRECFVPEESRSRACEDGPLLIGCGQTISQPYIVAFMTELLELRGHERILEIGTGSGYQTAVLAELAAQVFTVEIVPELSSRAETVLAEQAVNNVHFRIGHGQAGWPEQAPFDRLILTAAPAHFPEGLFDQLADGGVAVAPIGDFSQVLVRYRKHAGRIEREETISVIFVPLV